jgi:O-antigen ligase
VSQLSERIGAVGTGWLLLLAGLCAATGVLAGIDPAYALLAAGAIAFVVVVVADLTLGFVVFTFCTFLDLFSSSGSLSVTKGMGLLLFLSWLAVLSTRQRHEAAAFLSRNPGIVVAATAMIAWSALSVAWAASPGRALGATERYALNFMLLPIAFAAVRRREHVAWVMAAFIAGAVVSAAYGLYHPTPVSDQQYGRLTGTIGEANGEAAVLVAAIPLTVSLIGAIRSSVRLQLLALAAMAIAFVGLVDTLSRSGLLSLAAVMVAAVIFGGRWRRYAALLLLAGTCATVGYFFVLAPLSARERVTSTETSGRASIWTVAVRMFDAHPLLGVGNDNFLNTAVLYVNQPGTITRADLIVDTPKVVHNIYLEALADLGVPGLITLLALLAALLGAAIRAAWIFEARGDQELELMARGVVLALVGLLSADFFSSSQYAKYLWILLALCPVLRELARREQAGAAPA